MALTQPCKAIRVIAGVENGQSSAQDQHQDIKIFQPSSRIDPNQPLTFLLNIDGLCMAFEALPGNIKGIHWALSFAYEQSYGELAQQCGGDKTLYQALQIRAAAAQLAEDINNQFINNYSERVNGFSQKYVA